MGSVACPENGPVPAELRLAATLRWLAGASYIDLVDIYGFYSIHSVKWQVIAAITAIYDLPWMSGQRFNYDKFADPVLREEIKRGFAAKSRHQLFKRCIGAVDGWLPVIQRPAAAAMGARHAAYCNKGYYSINVQAVVDARRRFLYMDVTSYGSTHDSLAFSLTELAVAMADDPSGDYLVGDAAYPALEWCITPFKGERSRVNGQDNIKDIFNFYQSQVRINVECAFGMLQKRFGIFWRPLVTGDWGRVAVISVCMLIHNVCIDLSESDDVPYPEDKVIRGYRPSLITNGAVLRGGSTSNGIVRQIIMEQIQHDGLRRPRGEIGRLIEESESEVDHVVVNILSRRDDESEEAYEASLQEFYVVNGY
jgi:hypothetical protein